MFFLIKKKKEALSKWSHDVEATDMLASLTLGAQLGAET